MKASVRSAGSLFAVSMLAALLGGGCAAENSNRIPSGVTVSKTADTGSTTAAGTAEAVLCRDDIDLKSLTGLPCTLSVPCPCSVVCVIPKDQTEGKCSG